MNTLYVECDGICEDGDGGCHEAANDAMHPDIKRETIEEEDSWTNDKVKELL